jgi:hypothetical protein
MLQAEILERARDYKQAFATEHGKRVLEDLRKSCHFHDTTLDENPQVMAFNEGARSVLLRIDRIIRLLESGELEKEGSDVYFEE